MPRSEDEVRIAVALPQGLRDEMTDVCFILQVTEKEFVTKAIGGALKALKDAKGEKLTNAMELLRRAREDD